VFRSGFRAEASFNAKTEAAWIPGAALIDAD